MLSGQKADDFRSFAQLNPALLATTGAIFAAGVARQSTEAIVLSPIPLLLAVFQLAINTQLQLQLVTYLAVFGSAEGGRWERDVAKVRPEVYAERFGKRPSFLRPSGWNTWILFAVLTTEVIVAFPWLTGLPHGCRAFFLASAANACSGLWLLGTSDRVDDVHKIWTRHWEDHRKDLEGPVKDESA